MTGSWTTGATGTDGAAAFLAPSTWPPDKISASEMHNSQTNTLIREKIMVNHEEMRHHAT